MHVSSQTIYLMPSLAVLAAGVIHVSVRWGGAGDSDDILRRVWRGPLRWWVIGIVTAIWLVFFAVFLVSALGMILVLFEQPRATVAQRLDVPWTLLTISAVAAGLSAVIAFPFTLLRTPFNRRHTDAEEEGLLTDGINKAIERLGAQKEVNRRGRTVTFAIGDEERSEFEWKDGPLTLPDGASGRKDAEWRNIGGNDYVGYRLDLRRADLRGAVLTGRGCRALLDGARLRVAEPCRARLQGVPLLGAWLHGARLAGRDRLPQARRPRVTPLLIATLLLAVPAAAQEDPLSEAEHAAWTAIGRVNTGGLAKRTGCTGTLIAADLVLTAAHCVPERALRDETPEAVHFVAGAFRDDYAAHRTAAEVHVHPDYVRGRRRGRGMLHTDVALLVLGQPIPAEEVAPLPLAAMPNFAGDVEILAYANRRPGALERSGPCTAVALSPELLGLTCPVRGGNSGAPLLRPGEDGWRVVAVAVARDSSHGAFRSYAVRPAPVLFELAGREAP